MHALSNDQVALGFCNGTIKIVDLTDDTKSRTKEKAYVRQIMFLTQLSNGHLLSCGDDGSPNTYDMAIKIWNLADFSLVQRFSTGYKTSFDTLSISYDENLIAGGNRDKTIKLWLVIRNS